MLQSDRLTDLIERNRALLARAADLRSRTAETVIASQHLAATLREERRAGLGPVAAGCRSAQPADGLIRIGSIRAVTDKSWPWGEATAPDLTVRIAVMPSVAAPIVACLALLRGATNSTRIAAVSRNWTAYLDGGSAKWHAARLLAEAREARAVQSNIQIGYMNVHHQRVLANARIRGDENVGFVMWCSKCQRSYVACDGEVLKCRCPLHDHGASALAADSPAVEWLS